MDLSYQPLRIFVRSFMETIGLLRGDNVDLVRESEASFHLTFPFFALPDDKPINISAVFMIERNGFILDEKIIVIIRLINVSQDLTSRFTVIYAKQKECHFATHIIQALHYSQ